MEISEGAAEFSRSNSARRKARQAARKAANGLADFITTDARAGDSVDLDTGARYSVANVTWSVSLDPTEPDGAILTPEYGKALLRSDGKRVVAFGDPREAYVFGDPDYPEVASVVGSTLYVAEVEAGSVSRDDGRLEAPGEADLECFADEAAVVLHLLAERAKRDEARLSAIADRLRAIGPMRHEH